MESFARKCAISSGHLDSRPRLDPSSTHRQSPTLDSGKDVIKKNQTNMYGTAVRQITARMPVRFPVRMRERQVINTISLPCTVATTHARCEATMLVKSATSAGSNQTASHPRTTNNSSPAERSPTLLGLFVCVSVIP